MNVSTSEPFRRELTSPDETRIVAETEFEKPRGINKVEIRRGFLTVHVTGLDQDSASKVASSRLKVLKCMADAKVSIDFLKLTQGGLSFVVPEAMESDVTTTLDAAAIQYSVNRDRCIVLAHAANMRDEEGLIARVVSEVIGTGVEIDHLGDMHDRVLLVMDSSDGERVAKRIEERLVER